MPEELGPDQGVVLDAIGHRLHEDEWISGRKLRTQLAQFEPERVRATLASLAPEHVRIDGSEPDDQYTLTLEGLQHCGEWESARTLLEAILVFLRGRFSEDPDFRRYTWDELKTSLQVGDDQFAFVCALVSIVGWHRGGGGSPTPPPRYTWGTPRDIEHLVRCQDLDDCLRWTREQRDQPPVATGAAAAELADVEEVEWSDEVVAERHDLLDIIDLHRQVDSAARDHFVGDKFRNAVMDAALSLTERVRELVGRQDLDGKDLMAKTFSQKAPLLRVNDLADDFQRGEQEGWRFLFMGAMQALRNPPAHRLAEWDIYMALEALCFVSLLHRKLDQIEAKSTSGDDGSS